MNVLAKELPAASLDNEPPLTPVEVDDDEDDEKASIAPTSSLLDESHHLLLRRLAPLRDAQRALERSLGAASSEEVNSGQGSAAPWESGKFRPREFAVTSRSGWKAALNRVRGIKEDPDNVKGGAAGRPKVRSIVRSCELVAVLSSSQHHHRPSVARTSEARASEARIEVEGPEISVEHAAEVIASCAGDMHALWTDTAVRAVLDKRGIRPEEWPGL